MLGADMSALDKWIERVYVETDFGRSVATSVTGIIGLSVYLISKDWVVALFSSVIIFPIVRIVATGFHEKANRKKSIKSKKKRH